MPSAQLLWFGLEDRCRERGPELEAMVRFELTRFCLQDSCSTSWSYIALLKGGTGREAGAPLRTPRSSDSLRSARMSHAPIACEINWYPRKDLNLQPLVCRTSAPSVELLGHETGGRSWNRTNLSSFSGSR